MAVQSRANRTSLGAVLSRCAGEGTPAVAAALSKALTGAVRPRASAIAEAAVAKACPRREEAVVEEHVAEAAEAVEAGGSCRCLLMIDS